MDEQEYLANQQLLAGANKRANLHNTLAAVAAMSNNPGAAAAAKMAAADAQRQFAPQRLGTQGYMLPENGAFVPSKIYADEKAAARDEKAATLAATLAAKREAEALRLEDKQAAREQAATLAKTLASMRGGFAMDLQGLRNEGRGKGKGGDSAGKTLPATTVNKLSEADNLAAGFGDLTAGFQDSYGGGYGAMGVQNFLGKNMPNSKFADQSNWWQGYNDQKNVIRNKLFGSALTASEKAAFDAANIVEGMTPAQIRTKLGQQHAAAVRARNKLIANYGGSGYDVSGFDAMDEPKAALPGGAPRGGGPKPPAGLVLPPGAVYIGTAP